MPILVIITGEEMAFDWSENRPTGLDLSSDGIIVVTVQYRTNILGWFTLENQAAPGNIGLLDQNLALIWIRDNIKKFGGDPEKVTILGHGTGGAANVMAHLVSRRAKNLFSKAIIMSGTILSSYSFQLNSPTSSPSQQIIRNLACDGMSAGKVLECMQKKSLSDLMKSFENVYKVIQLIQDFFQQLMNLIFRTGTSHPSSVQLLTITYKWINNTYQRIPENFLALMNSIKFQ